MSCWVDMPGRSDFSEGKWKKSRSGEESRWIGGAGRTGGMAPSGQDVIYEK